MAVTVTFTCGHRQQEGGMSTPKCKTCGCLTVKSVLSPRPNVTVYRSA